MDTVFRAARAPSRVRYAGSQKDKNKQNFPFPVKVTLQIVKYLPAVPQQVKTKHLSRGWATGPLHPVFLFYFLPDGGQEWSRGAIP